ncbi:MAG: hypothetical protein LBH00_04705 [Planctomycetaceae bacterium]|jgi:hypothetical protein|nr:hypothetical protein [Planctomycetaceae bacterium]
MNDVIIRQKPVPAGVYALCLCVLCAGGCGTTKWSDTNRTATEQLLISNAIDRVAAKIDFSPMRNKRCFLNTAAIAQTTDHDYLAMTIRQHLAAEGAVLSSTETEADYIVEVRAGAVGTDRDELLIGIPAFTVPSLPLTQYTSATIPEIPFIKRTKQRGVAKVALFAYNKATGKPVWASGNNQEESTARNLWFAGTGPLTRGTIYHEPTFAGNPIPLISRPQTGDEPQVFSETLTPVPPDIPPASPVLPLVPPKFSLPLPGKLQVE